MQCECSGTLADRALLICKAGRGKAGHIPKDKVI